MTQLPILVSVVKIIKTLRTEGSLSPEELMKKVNAPKKTFYRALGALMDSGVVVKDSGRYYWHEFLGTMVYETELEYDLALEHSVNIVSGLKHIIGNRGTYYVEGELLSGSKYTEPAIMHLRTGYSGTYHVFEKAEKIRIQAHEKERELEEEVKEKILSSSLETQYPDNLVKMILQDIKEMLRGRKPYFLNDLGIRGGEVKSGAYTSLVKIEVLTQLKHFMIQEEKSRENGERCARIVELENKYYKLRQKFERETENLIMQVENGRPLKGSCPLCPRIKIAGKK